jgi:hypothetical protein
MVRGERELEHQTSPPEDLRSEGTFETGEQMYRLLVLDDSLPSDCYYIPYPPVKLVQTST